MRTPQQIDQKTTRSNGLPQQENQRGACDELEKGH
jgi:hypothetical protein